MNIHKFYSQIKEEENRNDQLLHLTANEPLMSDTARAFMGSRLSDRYYMGGGDEHGVVDFQPFTFLGFPGIQALVTAAEEASKEMLWAAEVNLSCLSGVHAMMCAILSTTEPGDTVMSVALDHGGHFATKTILERTGRKHITTSYNFDTLSFDVEQMAKTYKAAGAKAFYMDMSFYLNPYNLQEIREALGDEAIIIYDASHTMGLIMGQQFQAPLREGADVVCANTHKTLPGPQKGMIAFRDKQFGEKANGIINGGLYSSPHTVSMIALATSILEMKEFGEDYAKQIIANSNALGSALAKRGHKVRKANTGRFSENHQVHLVTDHIDNYRSLYEKLYKNKLVVNFDHALGGEMFIRLGTQELTRRGMKEGEMDTIADLLHRALNNEMFGDEVTSFVAKYQQTHYSFDAQQ